MCNERWCLYQFTTSLLCEVTMTAKSSLTTEIAMTVMDLICSSPSTIQTEPKSQREILFKVLNDLPYISA